MSSSSSTTTDNSSSSTSDSNPSLLGGHAKYVQGAVSSALGYPSGEQIKDEAVQEMKAAHSSSDSGPPTKSSLLGTVESAAGSITGCEGMQADGQNRLPHGAGLEETSGTG
ncbi:hypothetical protein PV10_04806 [Exophiala mesophila]|uniref:Uncharacterized protein n=1 Tax=Exophiala mesophila TaxID=212818 RepID=A0A0D1ZI96_EXOME|nr:uncharacterized protein PV10_04806 [Exophiala mesophila]KIV93604.1 hypothetical protein PV10_04806 [Exophiala mesophila]